MDNVDKYEIRESLYYDPKNHFWIDVQGSRAVIGLTPLIQETNGSFVAIQFSEVGSAVSQYKSFGTAEAEKHVGPLLSPISGKILAVNQEVMATPRLINDQPYDGGWLVEMELSNPEELNSMITGLENIREWFASELKRFDEKGWIAKP